MNFTNSLTSQLKAKFYMITLTQEAFKRNDLKRKYFTDLENFKILFLILETIAPFLSNKHDVSSLCTFQQLILTLMRLRLNFDFKYLAERLKLVILLHKFDALIPDL